MEIRSTLAALGATLLLAACGGGMEIGGPGLSASEQELVGDDPLDDGTINEGVGSVIP